jgi:transposase
MSWSGRGGYHTLGRTSSAVAAWFPAGVTWSRPWRDRAGRGSRERFSAWGGWGSRATSWSRVSFEPPRWSNPDETGWRVNGRGAWLHVVTDGKATTVYTIQKGRAFPAAASLLGKDYPGTIGSDGWAPYRKFEKATRQACLSHLIRRCKEMLETAKGAAARFPRALQAVLKKTFAVRDARDAGQLTQAELKVATENLDLEIGRLLVGVYRDPANRRQANHISTLREDLFRFLLQPGLEGTNWAAETELRYAVINRKTCGSGNRTEAGAAAQAILMTLSRTAKRRGHDDIALFADLLRAPKPAAHPLLLAAVS